MPLQQFNATPPEVLKAYGTTPDRFPAGSVLLDLLVDKGYGLDTAIQMGHSGAFGRLFTQLVLRFGNNNELPAIYSFLAKSLPHIGHAGGPVEKYEATPAQNAAIDLALSTANVDRGTGVFFGHGVATRYVTEVRIPNELRNVPVAVIGYGAAGILATNALVRIGFSNIIVFEKSKPLGIWDYENVYGRARNNPRGLSFFNSSLQPAPGGGEEVRRFLENLSYDNNRNVRFSGVTAVNPKDLDHRLVIADGTTERFPLVINTIGQGKPAPLSDPDRMTTTTPARLAGARWQQTLTREQVHRKRLVFIGLGNSTAEMLRQVHQFQDEGVDTDYLILTHYPTDAVHNPDAMVATGKGKAYRMFRNTSVNLVAYQGDLPESRYDYFRALRAGKIMSGVETWSAGKNEVAWYTKNRGYDVANHDSIYTLTGYRNNRETLSAMGCVTTKDGHVRCDWDGEMRSKSGKLRKGYFGFGAVLRSPTNPNAVVIPGMLHRIGDLAFGVAMRAAEYIQQQKR